MITLRLYTCNNCDDDDDDRGGGNGDTVMMMMVTQVAQARNMSIGEHRHCCITLIEL